MQNNTDRKFVNSQLMAEQPWQVIERDFSGSLSELPENQLLLPLAFWQANRDELAALNSRFGIWVDSDEEIEAVANDINQFAAIGVNFPVFTDGRGFSTGRLLRERYQFNGQLLALGNTVQDLWFYLRRCGFDAYEVTANANQPSKPLNGFSITYQCAVDQPEPLFRRR